MFFTRSRECCWEPDWTRSIGHGTVITSNITIITIITTSPSHHLTIITTSSPLCTFLWLLCSGSRVEVLLAVYYDMMWKWLYFQMTWLKIIVILLKCDIVQINNASLKKLAQLVIISFVFQSAFLLSCSPCDLSIWDHQSLVFPQASAFWLGAFLLLLPPFYGVFCGKWTQRRLSEVQQVNKDGRYIMEASDKKCGK